MPVEYDEFRRELEKNRELLSGAGSGGDKMKLLADRYCTPSDAAAAVDEIRQHEQQRRPG